MLAATPGAADENFVRALYLLLFDRMATIAEVHGWTSILPTSSRAGVAFAFLHSNKYRRNLIDLYYATFWTQHDETLSR
ncbi:MAG TPA: DUF4214 domain-containing protein [Gemmataceae bacterium]|jgi:hypothetical protein|nr:DUF4214 domain-containing protein [Gemmataceae bacterium]